MESSWLVNAFEGMRSEQIALSLDEVSGEMFAAQVYTKYP